MIDPNMPNNTLHAGIYLKGQKQAFLKLLKKICEDDLKTASHVSGLVLNEIEDLDKLLEAY